jgi:hypothetical protein
MKLLLSLLVAAVLLPSTAGAATRDANYSGGEGSTASRLDIAAAHASYDDAGTLTLTMRFAEPAPDPLPDGVLRWTVSSAGTPDDLSCPARRSGDISVRVTALSGSTAYAYKRVGRLEPEALSFPYSFGADRRTVTTTISEPGIADRDYRCIEATTDFDAELDTTDRVPFRLPLEQLTVRRGQKLHKSSKRPGSTTLAIQATDGANVTLRVKRRGKLFYSRNLTAHQGSPFRKRFRWSCAKPGAFRFTVQAKDAYGKKLTRRGGWKVSARRCARLERAERRAAERRAQRRAERERQRQRRENQSDGGSGGGCAPGYSPCLPITGDLDCDEIDDSLKPIRVTGADQYDLDRDRDGSGCDT